MKKSSSGKKKIIILVVILALGYIVSLATDGVFDKAYYEVRYFLTKEESQERFYEK